VSSAGLFEPGLNDPYGLLSSSSCHMFAQNRNGGTVNAIQVVHISLKGAARS
jgi:hypothetical protein